MRSAVDVKGRFLVLGTALVFAAAAFLRTSAFAKVPLGATLCSPCGTLACQTCFRFLHTHVLKAWICRGAGFLLGSFLKKNHVAKEALQPCTLVRFARCDAAAIVEEGPVLRKNSMRRFSPS